MLFLLLGSSTGVTSPGRRTRQGSWRLRAAQTPESPSPPRWCDPEECRAIHLAPGWPQKLPEGSRCRRPAALGAPFFLSVDSRSLSHEWICRKATEV